MDVHQNQNLMSDQGKYNYECRKQKNKANEGNVFENALGHANFRVKVS